MARPYSPPLISQSFGPWEPLLMTVSEERRVLSIDLLTQYCASMISYCTNHAQDSLVTDTIPSAAP